MKKIIITCAMVMFLLSASCGVQDASTPLRFPTSPPEIDLPQEYSLPEPEVQIQGRRYHLDDSVEGYGFKDCEVLISGDNVEIKNTIFINSQVFVDNRNSVVFRDSVFSELNLYEGTALIINESSSISVINCRFFHNYIGLGIHSSDVSVTGSRFEHNNGHNAVVIGEGSTARVEGNYFYGNFPHAFLIMNRESSPGASVEIISNVIEFTGEDAIDFEDYRNASPSLVANNVIRSTGWSAVLVEYNSWDADITISDNWIEGAGIEWPLDVHALQPEGFQEGWGHGILIEDSSRVTVAGNRIISAGQNGIEIRNGRDIVLRKNGIDCNQIGIAAYQYHFSSLTRPFSPLLPENAGGSQVIAGANIIYGAVQDYDVDDVSVISLD
jgi:parallel beta-helix repeat protein